MEQNLTHMGVANLISSTLKSVEITVQKAIENGHKNCNSRNLEKTQKRKKSKCDEVEKENTEASAEATATWENKLLHLGTSLTCPDGKRIIIENEVITISEDDIGHLHVNGGPKVPRCKYPDECTIDLHQTQGILCKQHPHPQAEHRDAIEFSLMARITTKLGPAYRMCVLCPGRLEIGKESLDHAR